MSTRPHRLDIGHVAEPFDAVEAGEFAELLGGKRAGILLVAIASKQELKRHASLAEERERIDESEHALVSEHTPDIGSGHRRRRLRQWR